MLIKLLNIVVLALPQIYTHVFHLWNSINLDSAWVEDFNPFQFSYLPGVRARLAMRHTRASFGVAYPKQCYWAF